MNIKQWVVLFRRSSSGGTGSSMRINQAFTENCEGRQNFVKVDFAYVKKDMISEIHNMNQEPMVPGQSTQGRRKREIRS